ncbi:MAG: hypothetical protein VKN83_07560 [Cyanobacteriota bacterium]|nr:hypothetical protein [Cyanobacteriota bacterium]
MAAIRQLVVLDHKSYGNATHMLVSSSSPVNAEEGAIKLPQPSRVRLDGQPMILEDRTDRALSELRLSLKKFLVGLNTSPQDRDSFLQALKGKLKIVLNIHGYSTPLAGFHENAYQRTQIKFDRDQNAMAARGTITDYVVFIDYSWPSEQALSLSLPSVLREMPFLLMALAAAALLIFCRGLYELRPSAGGVGPALGLGVGAGVLGGIVAALLLLRMVAYFRDRDRAASAAVYDGVELVRWLHQIFLEEITKEAPQIERVEQLRALLQESDSVPQARQVAAPVKVRVKLSLLAHSMGCFVATQLVRTLSDVFDPKAIDRWKQVGLEGPFSRLDPTETATDVITDVGIGELFSLDQLVLASPDIPVWALTNGRSNPLQACLRRFRHVSLFTNDADMVLRLLSTLANFFVFPSRTRQGGYRLGNVVPLEDRQAWGLHTLDLSRIGLHGMGGRLFQGGHPLTEPPFKAQRVPASHLSLVDCTDYRDREEVSAPWSPMLASTGPAWRPLRYGLTTLAMVFKRLDPHGGYFRGPFCLDLIYSLLLFGPPTSSEALASLDEELKRHQISWIDVKNPSGSTR